MEDEIFKVSSRMDWRATEVTRSSSRMGVSSTSARVARPFLLAAEEEEAEARGRSRVRVGEVQAASSEAGGGRRRDMGMEILEEKWAAD